MKTGNKAKSIALALGAGLAFSFLPSAGLPMMDATQSVAEAATIKAWDFSKDIGSWAYCGAYSYSGQASAAYDAAFGGSMKVMVDFSGDKDQSWSEVKLSDTSVTNAAPIKVGKGATVLTYDMYYDPAQVKGDAQLKTKVYAQSVKGEEVINQNVDDIGLATAKSVPGSTMKKVHVKVYFDDPVEQDISHIELSVVSYLTAYKGAIYINNIELK